ncbi:diaphanous GTPase-binding domain-containing protein [Ditylenchus destructor]|uniref:Diaphanous GTPase-binding domain-containing protein n=1 Tax=Ditylenchus destructor TaxID=166010 RepID=A0AAD4NGL6_9BILA|nr:diaphanous GTPase-binding domain-containing protein [Ditylenchus destructor]
MVGFGMHASTSGMPSSDPGPSTSMPPSEEILSAFEEVLKKMELPPDKVRTLRNCDLKKKWDLVCNQRMFKTQTVADPSVYLEKLSACLDTKAHKKKKKLPGGESEVLSHLEISLRTNSIDWVHSFLSPEHDGFRILVDYLSLLQGSYSEFYMPDNSNNSYGNATASPLHASQPTFLYTNSFDGQHYSSATSTISSSNGGGISFDDGYSSMKTPMNTSIFRTKPASSAAKASKQLKQINELEDDVHLCISCLRALMNNKAGWNIVFDSPQAIYCIVRSILHHSLRTKALAIDLLSAICMVKDGHERIVNAFDRFRMEYKERYRFQTLFHFFHSPSEFNVDFLASCMKYINVVVHSTEDLNQRVALQYEFTNLGLDRFLEITTLYPFMSTDIGAIA